MIGSNAFSWSCPPSDAIVTVMSLPITSNATWFMTSGMTGFFLARHDRGAGGAFGPLDLAQARLRSARKQPEIVAGLRQLRGDPLQHARQLHECAVVLCSFDEVRGRYDRQPGKRREVARHKPGVARVGVDAGADRRGAEVDLVHESRGLA